MFDTCILKASGSLATVGLGRRHVLASQQLILLISSASPTSQPRIAVANQALLSVLSVTCSCPVQQKYSLKVIYSVRNAISFCPVRKTPTRLPLAIMTPALSVLCQSQPADVLSRLHRFLHPGCKTANLPHQKCPLKLYGTLRMLLAMVSAPSPPPGYSSCSFVSLAYCAWSAALQCLSYATHAISRVLLHDRLAPHALMPMHICCRRTT